MLKKTHISLVGVAVAAVAILGLAVPVAAHEGHDHAAERAETTSAKERAQGRLDEAKNKVCANRVENVKKIMLSAATAGQRHFEKFSKVQQRVEEFYTKNKVTITNYASLIEAAKTKKVAADLAIQAVKDNAIFDCNGENPVGSIDAFNGKVRAMYAALKEYRSAISDLLLAVRNAAKGGQ